MLIMEICCENAKNVLHSERLVQPSGIECSSSHVGNFNNLKRFFLVVAAAGGRHGISGVLTAVLFIKQCNCSVT